MNEADVLLAGTIASFVLQAVKRFVPSDQYGVVLIAAGLVAGIGIAFARDGAVAIGGGAIDGIGGALAAAGVYSIGKTSATVEDHDGGRSVSP